ncbi:MAG: hypothetical protein E7647_06545 [Ruminococcaceae bacterium]|nr:hypothetical protein [Oscillospiraceae bacterium]
MNIFKSKKEAKSLPQNGDTIKAAYEILQRYKQGKASLEARMIENEQWWKMRHRDGTDTTPSPWLFNCITNKHADAMDNLPTVTCLPREASDTAAAKLLTDIMPVILDENKFEKTYSDCWYDKLKSGCACYGVFWDPSLSGGLGNVDIRRIDILNLFWEPGVNDIQHSQNVFHVELWDNSTLRSKYPVLSDSLSSPLFNTSRYIYDDSVDTSDKSLLIDWYYKKRESAKDVVHLCKFCNGILLYSSENDSEYRHRGFYDHGRYPFVMDTLYPVQGSPCGFGVIDAMKGTQAEIDALGSSVVKNAKMGALRRYFVRADGCLNEKEFADFTRPFVHYQGSGDPNSSIMPINTPLLSDVYVAILNNKIEELKETSGNYDFSQGMSSGGVTAASAIAALQEAGSKTARDSIAGSYRAYEEICTLIIYLISQFYTIPRCFRITGKDAALRFLYCSGADILSESGATPLFDLKIHAHKKSAFSRASANELALELYKLGVFNPEYAPQAEVMLGLMEFEGKDSALAAIRENAAHGQIGMNDDKRII